jgi:uncharacterized short protein YbdD (DUF466 family)
MIHPLRLVHSALAYARDVVGETGYERYLAHRREVGHPGPPLSRRDWFKKRTVERYTSGAVDRCC